MKAWAKLVSVAVTIVTLIVVIYLGYLYGSGRFSCWSEWHESGYDHKYSLRGGCKIQKDGKWIPAKNIRL